MILGDRLVQPEDIQIMAFVLICIPLISQVCLDGYFIGGHICITENVPYNMAELGQNDKRAEAGITLNMLKTSSDVYCSADFSTDTILGKSTFYSQPLALRVQICI